uniref:Uncharacterized protein n=1 Tax=Tetradesmus obliquus TaxID=3088 RepID=A0A383WH62_TETOB|eukprot:jgi/Sobl393_1/9610/SZX76582.1
MADALFGRSKRERKPSSRFSDYDQGIEAEAPTRSKAQPSLAKGSGGSQPVGGRSSTTRRTVVAVSDDSSDSDCDSSESESEVSSEECEEDDTDVQPNKRRAASASAARSVFGALDADERLALDQNRRNKKNEGTMKQYATVHGVWEPSW